MGSKATFPIPVGVDDPLFTTGTPLDIDAILAEIPDACNCDWEELMQPLHESTGHIPADPQSAGDTSHTTIAIAGHAGPATAATGAENLLEQSSNAHPWPWFGCPGNTGPFTGMVASWSAAQFANGGLTPTAPSPLAVPGPDRDLYSTGDTSCCASTAAAEVGSSSSLDVEANDDGAGASTETAVRGPPKRKRRVSGSSGHRSTPPPEFNLFVEPEAGLVRSDPSSTDIKPPTGSTDIEIIRFLRREECSIPYGTELNVRLGEEDKMCPKAERSYVTTVEMMPDQKTHLGGYWKEKQAKVVLEYPHLLNGGLKRTFQFHKYDDTKINWFMHEYVPTDVWGIDLFMKRLRFREVYKGAEVPDEPTSPEVKIKNKTAAAKKHRIRGPENLVIKGESPAWQHFIKIYDRHPELEGSKVVYAVCCHCDGVLKAGTENGTKPLLTHCDRTCPIKNRNQQPSPTAPT